MFFVIQYRIVTSASRVVTFRPDPEVLDGMEQLKERDGIPFSEQIRRALRLWLETKGLKLKSGRKRAPTR